MHRALEEGGARPVAPRACGAGREIAGEVGQRALARRPVGLGGQFHRGAGAGRDHLPGIALIVDLGRPGAGRARAGGAVVLAGKRDAEALFRRLGLHRRGHQRERGDQSGAQGDIRVSCCHVILLSLDEDAPAPSLNNSRTVPWPLQLHGKVIRAGRTLKNMRGRFARRSGRSSQGRRGGFGSGRLPLPGHGPA